MPEVRDVPARLTLFGYRPAPARLRARRRNAATRRTRALLTLGASVLLAPLLGLLPPHIPWALAVLGLGAYMAYRQWNGTWRVLAFEGDCPACGGALSLDSGALIDLPTTMTCYECHQEPRLAEE